LINVVSGGVSIGACLVATFFVDRIGRKPLLFVGSLGMAASLGTMAFVFARGILQENGSLSLAGQSGVVALVAANLYVIFFNASWGPVMWIMLGEMFPNQIRGSGLAISGLSQWVTNFAITMSFPILLTGIGLGGTYGIYAAFALVSAVFIAKFTHETKGVELEDMKG
jgi:SP family sugar:H+ symporter-like MFS transporter